MGAKRPKRLVLYIVYTGLPCTRDETSATTVRITNFSHVHFMYMFLFMQNIFYTFLVSPVFN